MTLTLQEPVREISVRIESPDEEQARVWSLALSALATAIATSTHAVVLVIDDQPRTPPRPRRLAAVRAPAHDVLVETLTPKEIEVLGHLAEMLSTDEIAAAMFVSVNTVRTHVRGILRKLAVSRRADAVRRGRALSLIDA